MSVPEALSGEICSSLLESLTRLHRNEGTLVTFHQKE